MFQFAHIQYLWLLAIVPCITVLHILYSRHKRRQMNALGDEELVRALMPNASRIRPHVKFALEMLALTLLIIACARPRYGTKEQTIHRQDIEAMIALDISNSMLAEDITPNRLDKSKQMLSKLIDNMVDDKVGLVVFAGEAFTQLPITCDYVSAKMFLQNIRPELIMAQGTAIGHALNCCVRSFGEKETEASRVIILITDGENHEDDAIAAAKAAKEKGILIYVVGIGKPEGSPIPDGRGNFKKDRSGQVVISRLNEDMCQQIAAAGGGVYVRADNTNAAFKVLEKELDRLSKADIETKVYTDYNEQYQSFVLIALLLLVIDFFVFTRKNKVITKMNIFGDKVLRMALLVMCLSSFAGISAQEEYRDIRLGNREYKGEDYTQAEVRYRKALDKNPRSFEAHFNLGDALFRQEKVEEALAEFAQAGLLVPEHQRLSEYSDKEKAQLAAVHHNMGNCYYVAQQYDKAVQSYQRALIYNPKDDETRYNLIKAMQHLQQGGGGGSDENEDENDNENENQQQQEQEQEQEQQQQQNNEQQPEQPDEENMTREQAEQILRALQQDEQETQEKAQQQRSSRFRTDKDW